MNMMMNEEDPLFKDLISGYVADTPDDGFTENLIARRNAQVAREKSIRRLMLGGAFFAAGMVAGTQIGKLINWFQNLSAPSGVTSLELFPYLIAMTFVFVMWLSLESRSINL